MRGLIFIPGGRASGYTIEAMVFSIPGDDVTEGALMNLLGQLKVQYGQELFAQIPIAQMVRDHLSKRSIIRFQKWEQVEISLSWEQDMGIEPITY
jgi:hypothetical protein